MTSPLEADPGILRLLVTGHPDLPAAPPPAPGPEHVLRYEARARLLAREGRVDRAITWRDHFLPAVASLES